MTDRELMQMALDILDDINQCSLPPTGIPLPAEIDHVMEALRARLAQPEPEPVAWADKADIYREGHDFWVSRQKPSKNGVPLYTAPPQREWQGLTKEELAEISEFHFHGAFSGRDFYEDIETRLKEKNT